MKKYLIPLAVLLTPLLIAVLVVSMGSYPQRLDIPPAELDIPGLLTVILFVSLLIQGSVEVLMSIIQDPDVPKEDIKKANRKRALVMAYCMGLCVAFSGFRVLDTFFQVEINSGVHNALVLWVDTVLSAGLYAGGSQPIHQIAKSFKAFTELLQSRAKAEKE